MGRDFQLIGETHTADTADLVAGINNDQLPH